MSDTPGEEDKPADKAAAEPPQIGEMNSIRPSTETYSPPKLEITEEDKMRFLDALAHGQPYEEEVKKGPIEVTFRVKSRRETDYLAACIRREFQTGEISQPMDYLQALNTYNLRICTKKLGGQPIEEIQIPSRPWFKDPPAAPAPAGPAAGMMMPPQGTQGQQEVLMGSPPPDMAQPPAMPPAAADFSLRGQVEDSFMADFSDSQMFVLVGLLAQFDDKVQRMQREMLNPDFTAPGAPSS